MRYEQRPLLPDPWSILSAAGWEVQLGGGLRDGQPWHYGSATRNGVILRADDRDAEVVLERLHQLAREAEAGAR
jgi:hypothetical protein